MNTPILFLLGALALSMLGGMVVWLSSRPRKERFGSTIETFSRDLDALAPNRPPARSVADGERPRPGPRVQRPRPENR